MPRGTTALRILLVWGALGVFAGLWISFFIRIWQAGDGAAPQISSTALYVASVLGGVLATLFAVALGIQRKDPKADTSKLRLGSTLVRSDPSSPVRGAALATAAVWLYAGISVFSLVTVFFHSVQSPQPVKTMASAFASLVLALFSAALAPGQARE